MSGTFHWYDTKLGVQRPGTKPQMIRGKGGARWSSGTVEPDWTFWGGLIRVLIDLGHTNEPDAKVRKHYPTLDRYHRQGRSHDLQWAGHCYPMGCEIEFFQDLVVVNRSGGRYDFDRLQKMPYRVRLRFEKARRAINAHLLALGLTERVKIESAVPDPLAYFNDQWGANRFERGPDGWPTMRDLGARNCLDADGSEIGQGEVRYFRTPKGHLMRGRAYGGVNGRWIIVCGPGPRDFTGRSAFELFSWRPGLLRKAHSGAERAVQNLLTKAVKAEAYEKAIPLRDVLKRLKAREAA